MPGYFDSVALEGEEAEHSSFSVISQKVEFEVDFATRSLSGSTEIVAQPSSIHLKAFRLHCRQCRITRATIEGKPTTISYLDPYEKVKLRRGISTIHQHGYLRSKIEPQLSNPPHPELSLGLPKGVSIRELDDVAVVPVPRDRAQRKDSDVVGAVDTPNGLDSGPQFAPLKIYIEFQVSNFRDGLHMVGFDDGDKRYPHMYTRTSMFPGTASSLFPCQDTVNSRSIWDISFRCPRTLGDAFRRPSHCERREAPAEPGDVTMQDGDQVNGRDDSDEYLVNLSDEERSMELSVVCSGEMTDDNVDPADPTQRNITFHCDTPVAARHLAFAIGPFEYVDLSAEFRQSDEDDKLGQSAIKVHGYCLPGRADELRNTCMPIPKGIDYFTVNYGSFPFASYKMCFVDDLMNDFSDAAGLSICSNRLLFPEDVIDPLDPNTRIIVLALASQYSGVNVIPSSLEHTWAITGIAGFMADVFMKKLAGNNEYRFRQKLACDKVFDIDVGRFSLHTLGSQLDIDPSELDFLRLKSSLVLFILNNRLTKASGSSGMSRIITRIFLNAKTGDLVNGELSTEYLQRTCEKLGHTKLDVFFKQWVYHAGCPDFLVQEQFNKKKLVVELTITQKQSERPLQAPLHRSTFLREAKEQDSEAWAGEPQSVFTGPMTIRIHEADGTPYEHIIEIKEGRAKYEIPYNTKYKRLKRSKKAKERTMAKNGAEQVGDSQDDVLLYCLGDTLQADEDHQEWHLSDWTPQQEQQMGDESYEWVRMDADFEWIGRIHSTSMKMWSYMSQLQQDRDVVAHYQSVQRILYNTQKQPHPLASTFLIRTLMDERYFHGIRSSAAEILAMQATAHGDVEHIGLFHLQKAYQELYCVPGSTIPKANDFSNRASYLVQCAILRAIAAVRDREGRSPFLVQQFFMDRIKFNDNSSNEFSDCSYVGTLLQCLAQAIVAHKKKPKISYAFQFGDNDGEMDEDEDDENVEETRLKTEAINEIERLRRFDEWIASYHNTYTVAAIGCLEILSESEVVPNRVADILQYTRPGNADNVRLRAFMALVGLKYARRSQILKYILYSLGDDPSPYMRAQLLQVFGQALGSIAIGDDQPQKTSSDKTNVDSGIIMEEEAPAESRQIELARKESPEGALHALKLTVAENEILKSSLWHAILSPNLSIHELASLLDVARLLYETSSARESLVVTLTLPRTYRVEHMGKAKLRFYHSSTVRTKPSSYAPLTPADWANVQDSGLKYTGPVPKKTFTSLPPLNTAAQDAVRIEHNKAAFASSGQMSAPPLPTPSGTPGIKISFNKRKPSVDIGRAGSPKAAKVQKTSTPNSAAHQRSPSVSAQPAGASPTRINKQATKTKLVKLKTRGISSKIQSILSKPPSRPNGATGAHRQSLTPMSATQAEDSRVALSKSPQPPNGVSPSPGTLQAGWKMGAFRNYGAAPAHVPTQIKTEERDVPPSAISPKTVVPPASGGQENGTHPIKAENADDVPKPAAPRKLTIKFGKKNSSSTQGPPT